MLFACSILSLDFKNHHDSLFPSANVGDVEVGIYLESGGNMISAELWSHWTQREKTSANGQKQTDFPGVFVAIVLVSTVLHSWFSRPSVWLAERWERFRLRSGTADLLMGVGFQRVCYEMHDFFLHTHLIDKRGFWKKKNPH